MIATRHRSRAADLLQKIVAIEEFDRLTLARELVVTGKTLDAYLDGVVPMPLDRQLCLALFAIEAVPSLASAGHRLHGQVKAAIAFNEHVTATHDGPPASLRNVRRNSDAHPL